MQPLNWTRLLRLATKGIPNTLRSLLALLALVGLVASGYAAVERYDYDPLGRLIRYIDPNNLVTEYTYDAAGNLTSVKGGASAANYVPVLSSVNPSIIRRGESKSITISGQQLKIGVLTTSDTELDLSNVQRTATEIKADLSAGLSANLGKQKLTYTNAAGTASVDINVAPVLPVVSVEPSPLALPPDNKAHLVTIRLSSQDTVDHVVNLSFSDATRASVSPASVSFAAGQTVAQINVTSKLSGFTNLQLRSSTLASADVPVFVTADFRGANTSYAQGVGVRVGEESTNTLVSTSTSFLGSEVGVSVGTVLTGVSPAGMAVGSTQKFTIVGNNIPSDVSVAFLPSTGLTVGTPVVAADGSRIEVSVTADATAQVGGRSVVLRSQAGVPLHFVKSAKPYVVLTTGQPVIYSLEPLFAKPGSKVQIKLRGANLQNGQFAISPATDIAVDSSTIINADGTEMLVTMQIDSLAARGARVVQITTPSGTSTDQANSANQLTLVSEMQDLIGPIFSPAVGLMVGTTDSQETTIKTEALVGAPHVGVVTGSVALSLSPKVGVVGTSVNFAIKGIGLGAVKAVGFVTPDGLTPAAFNVSADGTTLTLAVAIATDATKSKRKIVLTTETGVLPFINDAESSFLVAAPVPELITIAPQVVKAGTQATLTVRGKNFRDIQAVRFEPSDGLASSGSISANADGTLLTVPVSATADAVTGPRTMIVVAAGGESSNLAFEGNTLQVAQQVGPTYADIGAPLVGLMVGSTPEPEAAKAEAIFVAPLVGVNVEMPVVQETVDTLISASPIGIVVGASVRAASPVSPDGFLAGSTAQITVTGTALESVTAIRAVGTTDVTFDGIKSNADGTQVTARVVVGDAVASGGYGLVVIQTRSEQTSPVATSPADVLGFSVGRLPTQINSVTPIVVEQAKNYTFVVRGVNLKDVYQLQAEPNSGLTFGSVQWSSDHLGEKLAVPLTIDTNAAIGSRVVRLKVPGGITSSSATPATTITIVAPQ